MGNRLLPTDLEIYSETYGQSTSDHIVILFTTQETYKISIFTEVRTISLTFNFVIIWVPGLFVRWI